jgi:tRNA(adenine34) deaminase
VTETISEAQKALGKMRLRNCTIYSNAEPCPMCSFPIREARISRVVFAIKSPIMGGFSRWNVLRDAELSNTMPEAFAEPPEVVSGLLARGAEAAWNDWNPLIWKIIKYRGCFAGAEEAQGHWHQEIRQGGFVRSLLAAVYR